MKYCQCYAGPSVFTMSGIHKKLMMLAGIMDSWANRLKSLIGRPETLHYSDWLKALGSWINLCDEVLVNMSNTQAKSERIKHKPHTK